MCACRWVGVDGRAGTVTPRKFCLGTKQAVVVSEAALGPSYLKHPTAVALGPSYLKHPTTVGANVCSQSPLREGDAAPL